MLHENNYKQSTFNHSLKVMTLLHYFIKIIKSIAINLQIMNGRLKMCLIFLKQFHECCSIAVLIDLS